MNRKGATIRRTIVDPLFLYATLAARPDGILSAGCFLIAAGLGQDMYTLLVKKKGPQLLEEALVPWRIRQCCLRDSSMI